MQEAMYLKAVQGESLSESQDQRRPAPVLWAFQVILLVLVAPALVAVLLIGGVCVSVQKIVSVTEHVFAMDRASLKTVSSHHKV